MVHGVTVHGVTVHGVMIHGVTVHVALARGVMEHGVIVQSVSKVCVSHMGCCVLLITDLVFNYWPAPPRQLSYPIRRPPTFAVPITRTDRFKT